MPDTNNSQNETHHQIICRYSSQKFGINWKTVTISDINLIEDINERDEDAWTPLLAAALSNSNPEIITALINKGADINARLETGLTPLHLAADNNDNPEIIEILINNGADVNEWSEPLYPLHKGVRHTPLHRAATYNINPKIIMALIKNGADVNAQSKRKRTPLHWAAWCSENPEIIATLLNVGSDPTAKDEGGETAYDIIQRNEKLKDDPIVEKLRAATN